MKAKVLALLAMLLPVLLSAAFLSSATVVAQDRSFILENHDDPTAIIDQWGGCTLKGAAQAGKTSGQFEANGAALPGWTWSKDGNDYLIRNGAGQLMFTMDEAANTANDDGACVDNTGTQGDYGGTWYSPD